MATTYRSNLGTSKLSEAGNNTIVQADNGHLFCLRYEQSGDGYRLYLMRSIDKGKTWNTSYYLVGAFLAGARYWETASIFCFGNLLLIVARSGGYEMRTFTFNATANISTGVYGDIYIGTFMEGFMATYEASTNRFMILIAYYSSSQGRYFCTPSISTDGGATWAFVYVSGVQVDIPQLNAYGGMHRLSNGKTVGFAYKANNGDNNRYLHWLVFNTIDTAPVVTNITGVFSTAYNSEFKTLMVNDTVYCIMHQLENVSLFSVTNGVLTSRQNILTNVNTNHRITATTDGKNIYVITSDRMETKLIKVYIFKNNLLTLINTISIPGEGSVGITQYIDAPSKVKGAIYIVGNAGTNQSPFIEFNAQTLAYSGVQGQTGTGLVDTETIERWDGVKLVEVTPNYWDGVKLVAFD